MPVDRLKMIVHRVLCAVLALLATLAAGFMLGGLSMLFFDYGRGVAQRSVESSNLRQIGQAALIFASENRNRLPSATDLPDYARQLAIDGGLNDASVWVKANSDIPGDGRIVLGHHGDPPAKRPLKPEFAQLPHLFTVPLNGITANMPDTTPIAWTRGLDPETGRWRADSPYGGEGGHIVFLNGNVSFFPTLSTKGGELRSFSDGSPTSRILEALPPGTRISESPTPPPTSLWEWLIYWAKSLWLRTPDLVRDTIPWLWLLWMLALFPTLTVVFDRNLRQQPRSLPRLLKRNLIFAPVGLIALSAIFRV